MHHSFVDSFETLYGASTLSLSLLLFVCLVYFLSLSTHSLLNLHPCSPF